MTVEVITGKDAVFYVIYEVKKMTSGGCRKRHTDDDPSISSIHAVEPPYKLLRSNVA